MKQQFITLVFVGICSSWAFAQKPSQQRPSEAQFDSVSYKPRGESKSHRAFFENLTPEERKKIQAMSVEQRRKYLYSKGLRRPRSYKN